MLLNNDFSTDLSKFQVITSLPELKDLDEYLQAVIYNLVYYLTNCTKFGLRIIAKEPNKKILIKIAKRELILTVLDKYITVEDQNINYFIKHSYTKKGISLVIKEIKYNYQDKQITECYNEDLYYLNIVCSNKAFILSIPYHTDFTLNLNFLANINDNTTIEDLKNIYLANFSLNQEQYYLNRLTELNILEDNIVKERMVLKKQEVMEIELKAKIKDMIITLNKKMNFPLDVNISNLENIEDLSLIAPTLEELIAKINSFSSLSLKRVK